MKNSTRTINKITLLNLGLLAMFIWGCINSFVAYAGDVAGKTILAKGKVEAVDQTSKEKRKLRRRSEIFNVDNIITGGKSKAQFSMSDGGLITLKENTEILISDYKFNPDGGEASATIEIVNGGLRSISGLIKKSGGDYQVKTPVGSIGIRGTHFAVEVAGDDVVFAVYSGNIDIQLNDQSTLSLGSTEDYSYASVNSQGEVTPMTQPPASISLGFTDAVSNAQNANSSNTDSTEQNQGSQQNVQLDNTPTPLTSRSEDLQLVIDDSSVYSEAEWQGVSGTSIAELLAQRTGSLSYNNVIQSEVNSSAGQVSNFTMNMTVDFDNASVPGGSLSFVDSQGEWFATYSGLINIDRLELGINFASHGDNRADGSIFAGFSNGLDELTGGFNLQEINNPSVNANGSFKIQP